MSWVLYLLKDSELFIFFAESSQILLKISVILILLTFIYLVALKPVSKQPAQLIVQLNSSLRQIIDSLNLRLWILSQAEIIITTALSLPRNNPFVNNINF